jgi:hypothetical protein
MEAIVASVVHLEDFIGTGEQNGKRKTVENEADDTINTGQVLSRNCPSTYKRECAKHKGGCHGANAQWLWPEFASRSIQAGRGLCACPWSSPDSVAFQKTVIWPPTLWADLTLVLSAPPHAASLGPKSNFLM